MGGGWGSFLRVRRGVERFRELRSCRDVGGYVLGWSFGTMIWTMFFAELRLLLMVVV